MRPSRNAQSCIFDFYCKHEQGKQLAALSELIDQHPVILHLIEQEFDKSNVAQTGTRGMSLESIFRCLLL